MLAPMKTIQIHVKTVQQLFEFKDPSPFWERDLDSSFANYLVSSAYELRRDTTKAFRISIQIDESEKDLSEVNIDTALKSYFNYQIDNKRREFKRTLKTARIFLLVGLLSLSICLVLAQGLTHINSEAIRTSLREGVIIFGWVSLWKPLEVFLFDWYPIYDQIKLYRQLNASEVEVKFLGLNSAV